MMVTTYCTGGSYHTTHHVVILVWTLGFRVWVRQVHERVWITVGLIASLELLVRTASLGTCFNHITAVWYIRR
jgi:hypothetical protein